MKLSKKKEQKIQLISVFDKLYREIINPRFWSGGKAENGMCKEPFYVEPPENWSDDDKELFDLMTQIEDQLKTEILEILEK